MNFYKLLSTFVGHFCPPGSGSGSTDPIEYGSNTDPDPVPDPDPQPWFWGGLMTGENVQFEESQDKNCVKNLKR